MAHGEARAWWAEVEHLRNDYERTAEARRRADQADLATRRMARERRRADADIPPRRPDHIERASYHELRLEPGRAPTRRTVEIRGRTVPAPPVPRNVAVERRRPPRLPGDRIATHPDRMALWALMMGLMLIAVAIVTADASAAIIVP
jgi:hypothetical protein